jgi:hypothetical protein
MRLSERQTTWCLTIELVSVTKKILEAGHGGRRQGVYGAGKAYCSQHAGRVGDVFDHEDRRVSPKAQGTPRPLVV